MVYETQWKCRELSVCHVLTLSDYTLEFAVTHSLFIWFICSSDLKISFHSNLSYLTSLSLSEECIVWGTFWEPSAGGSRQGRAGEGDSQENVRNAPVAQAS